MRLKSYSNYFFMFTINKEVVFFIVDPLEQFDSLPVLSYDNLTIVNNITIYCVLIFAGLFLQLLSGVHPVIKPTNAGSFANLIFNFVKSIVIENVNKSAQKHFPLIFYTFTFLLFCNMVGMVPYTFTITSSFTVTLYLSLGFFIGVNIIGWYNHRSDMLSLFLPGGAPIQITPFLIIIELISYFARIFSLSIRLFANMMSGHTLLKILVGFSYNMYASGSSILKVALVFPVLIVFLVTGLELSIAFLQAYVFTVLMCIYLNDVFSFH